MSAVAIPGTIRGRVGTVREIILGGAPASLKDHIENFPEKHPFLIRRFADVFKMPPNSLVTAAELNKGIDRIRADIIARVNPSDRKSVV